MSAAVMGKPVLGGHAGRACRSVLGAHGIRCTATSPALGNRLRRVFCPGGRVPDSMHRAFCSATRVPDSMHRAFCSTGRAPDSTHRAFCSTGRVPDSALRAFCSAIRVPDSAHRAFGSNNPIPDSPCRTTCPAARARPGCARFAGRVPARQALVAYRTGARSGRNAAVATGARGLALDDAHPTASPGPGHPAATSGNACTTSS